MLAGHHLVRDQRARRPRDSAPAKADYRAAVKGQFSNQRDKEAAYARLNMLLEQRAIVLPNDGELLRQLGGVAATLTPSGGMRIEARLESIHDDLPDALSLGVSKLPAQLPEVPTAPVPEGTEWAETPAGVRVPLTFTTLRPEHAWDQIYGGIWNCPDCHVPVGAYRETCTTPACTGTNPDPPAPKAPAQKTTSAAAAPTAADATRQVEAEARPLGNYWNPDLWECRNRHKFDRRFTEKGPDCNPGHGPRPGRGPGGSPVGSAQVPAAHQRALAIGLRR